MKIAQISPYFYPHLGGVESHVLELSKHLKKRGHDITVFTTLLDDTVDSEVVEGIKVKRIKPLTILFSTPINLNIARALEDEEFDIIHGHSPPPLSCFFAAKYSHKADIPFALTYHCDLELPFLFGPLMVQIYQRTLATYTVKKSQGIITTTDTYGATSRTVWQEDARVIPNAVDAHTFNPHNDGSGVRKKHGIADREKVVLYVGRIVYHKGLQYLVESARYLDKGVKYIIGGSGDYMEELKNTVERFGLEDRVIFPGRIPNDELPQYYGASDVFVLPSVSRLEAFGIVALEAMASEVPVVVSDIPGVREVIIEGRHGLLAEPMKAIDIAGKVRTILENPGLAKRMGRAGREVVLERYTWDIVAEQIEEFYFELVNS